MYVEIKSNQHVICCDRPCGWEEQDHTDETNPAYRNHIDWQTPSTQGVRTLDKMDPLPVNNVGQNDRDIGKI